MSILVTRAGVTEVPEAKMAFPFVYVLKREQSFADLVMIRRYCDEARNKSVNLGQWNDLVLTHTGNGERSTWPPFAAYGYSHVADDVAWSNRVKGDKFVVQNEVY